MVMYTARAYTDSLFAAGNVDSSLDGVAAFEVDVGGVASCLWLSPWRS